MERRRKCPAGDDERLVGDPVDVVTGANTDRALDFELVGPPRLRFFRHYDSRRAGEDAGLGPGHRHSLDERLNVDATGARYDRPDGTIIPFPPLGDGEFASAGGYDLVRVNAGEYRVFAGTPEEPTRIFVAREGGRYLLARLDGGAFQTRLGHGPGGELASISTAAYSLTFAWIGPHLSQVLRVDPSEDKPRALITYQYDGAGRLVRGTDLYHHSFALAYDDAHRVVMRSDRRGYRFLFDYDEQGRCIRSRGEDGALEVNLTYSPEQHLTVVRKGDGGEWQYSHDTGGNLSHIVDPYGGVTAFIRDPTTGQLIKQIDPAQNVSTYVHDSQGKVALQGPFGDQRPPGDALTEPAHDVPGTALAWEAGDLVAAGSIVLPTADDSFPALGERAAAALVRSPVPGVGAFRPVRDANNLHVRDERADGASRRYAYDPNGRLRKYVDPDGRTWRHENAHRNLRVATTDPLGRIVRFEYNAAEELVAVVDAGGTRSEYVHDLKDRLVEVHRHGKLRDRYDHDLADQIISKHRSDGALLLTFEWGPGGRKTARKLASGEEQRFTWDRHGRLAGFTSAAGTCQRSHDEHGRRTSDLRDGKGVTHVYTDQGLVETRVLGRFLTRYEPRFGTQSLTDPTGKPHRLEVLKRGVLLRRLGNGTTETAQFDAEGRCLLKVLEGPEGAWIRRYRYSPGGDLLESSDSRGGNSTYKHDAAGRLVEEKRGDVIDQYRHDAGNNLLSLPGAPALVVGSGNRLASGNGERFSYDQRDHLQRREGGPGPVSYEYDERDLLVGIKAPGLEWTARHDALGRRTEKIVNGERWEYHWDEDRLVAELRPGGALRIYVYPDGRALMPLLFVDLDSLTTPLVAARTYYVHTNHLACPERISDARGQVVWQARIAPYGTAHVEVGASFHQPLRWPGHHFDAETGLHYNRFRYYDPTLGRYLQSDPLGITGGYNLYAYTTNPLREVDVRGLGAKDPCNPDAAKVDVKKDEPPKEEKDKPAEAPPPAAAAAAAVPEEPTGPTIAVPRSALSYKRFGDKLAFYAKVGDESVYWGACLYDGSGPGLSLNNNVIVNGQNVKLVPPLVGGNREYSFTQVALSYVLNDWYERNGEYPENMGGILADKNLSNFQKEYGNALARGRTGDQASNEAIRKISFGKQRQSIPVYDRAGNLRDTVHYDDFAVSASGDDTVEIEGLGPKPVPDDVSVVARRRK